MTTSTPTVRVLNPSFKSPIPVPETCIRIVCLSDTHSQVEHTDYIKYIPHGDVLLHAGDFTSAGEICELTAFNEFLEKLPHRIKIAIPGNHEVTLDPRRVGHNSHRIARYLGVECGDDPAHDGSYQPVVDKLLDYLPNAVILMDSWVSICGIKIHGYPWVPRHGMPGFGLMRSKDKIAKQNLIPDDTDILLSHGPAHNFCDMTKSLYHVGCKYLAEAVTQRIKPKLLVCGHIHEAHGMESDGTTLHMNVSVCNRAYKPVQPPIVVDYTLPQGFTREQFLHLEQRNLVINKAPPELEQQQDED